MTVTTFDTATIYVETECAYPECSAFASQLYLQLSKGYDVCSVMPVPFTVDEWRAEHRTARKRADRAVRAGYYFDRILREQHSQDIHDINRSLKRRQGRPMAPSYQVKTLYLPLPQYPCLRHRISTYGVLLEDVLVAYLWLYRSGELALVSSILGHGDHLKNDVMYLLFQGVVDLEGEHGGQLVYNRWDSGGEGLRYYKSKVGFAPVEVLWQP